MFQRRPAERLTVAVHGVLKVFLLAAMLLAALPSVLIAEEPPAAATERPAPVVMTERGRDVHRAAWVFDGHNDLPWEMRTTASSSFTKRDIAQPQPAMHTDIPRLRAGNVRAQFWSVYVPAETSKAGTAFTDTIEQIDLVDEMVRKYPAHFAFCTKVSEIEAAVRDGKIASLIGVEGGHAIEDSLEKLRQLRKRGAAYMTLTHSDTLQWADAATDSAKHDGLSPFGEEVVLEMNRLGMLVDLSHVSDATMRDALTISRAPVIFSHSSARAIANHPRNVPDDVLKLVREKQAVVMVNFFPGFVVPESAEIMKELFKVSRALRAEFPMESDYRRERRKWEATHPYPAGDIHHVIDHIMHLVKVAGVDCVGIGSDYDGITKVPKQLEDVSTYPLITEALLERGLEPADIEKIMHGNVLRVMRAAEETARSLNAAR